MSELFYDEPTVQIRRSQNKSSSNEKVEKTSKIDVFGTEQIIENLEIYGSPLLNAATELLGILVTLPRQKGSRDIDCFRQKVLDALISFRERGEHLDYHPNIIEKTCFVFCAAFDEMIMYTAWGEQAHWENHSLLSKVFLQRNGGEVFFILLEKACKQQNQLIDFIELQYVLLMLGFKGRYRHGDESELHQIKANAYTIIRPFRNESELMVPKTPKLIEKPQPKHLLNFRKAIPSGLFIVFLSYIGSEYWYNNQSQEVLDKIASVNLIDEIVDENISNTQTNVNKQITFDNSNLTNASASKDISGEYWDIILAVFKFSVDAERLLLLMDNSGYNPLTRETPYGTELYIRSNDSVEEINKLKIELNIRFGLNVTIKRAHK